MLSAPVRYCANVTVSPALKTSWKKRKATSKNPTIRATANAFFTLPLSCGDLGLRLGSRETHLYAANADRRHPSRLFFTSSQRECAAPRIAPELTYPLDPVEVGEHQDVEKLGGWDRARVSRHSRSRGWGHKSVYGRTVLGTVPGCGRSCGARLGARFVGEFVSVGLGVDGVQHGQAR